jgi:hypothetical protein
MILVIRTSGEICFYLIRFGHAGAYLNFLSYHIVKNHFFFLRG